ncbi:MAG TPA: hypothetical protein PKE57_02115 [Cellvibrionaceae bacterium]|nr:hypothetical protein [Cellvibrionaceae bacterium]HNG59000.1 hypothetical protein [Cellvibrionaceae bacterium]
MQQVNLYLKELRPKFDPFAARPLLMFTGFFVCCLLLWAGFAHTRVNNMQAVVDTVVADVRNEEAKLSRLKVLGKPGDKTQLEDSASQVRTAIDNREFIKRLISSNTFGNDRGFSVLLTALSKAALKDLFLREFGVAAGGRDVYLHGITTRVDAVPEYIKILQQDAAMAKVNFGVLKLLKAAGGQIEFSSGLWDEQVMGAKPGDDPQAAAATGQGR